MKKIKYILGLILSIVIIIAAGFKVTTKIIEATSATTYTRTVNADKLVIRCQDGYLPETTFDRIGLDSPQDMVIDKVIEDGNEVEYGYILNKSTLSGPGPFILKFRLDDVSGTVSKIDLKNNLPYIANPTGLWIATTTVQGITRKELYIADDSATYTEVFPANEQDRALLIDDYTYTYKGLVYRVQFDMNTNELDLHDFEIIHEPVQEVSRSDYDMYELHTFENPNDTSGYTVIPTANNFKGGNNTKVVLKQGEQYEGRVVPLGQLVMKTSSFGQDTVFNPIKVAVDSSGNMFIASQGTSAGMIQMSYSGEFISFFVVNEVAYNFLYQFIKNFGTKEQLEKLNAASPASFYNVFIDYLDLVYSVTVNQSKVFDKYSTAGSSILENPIDLATLNVNEKVVTDTFVTKDGLIFITIKTGSIYVFAPDGRLIFFFGSSPSSTSSDIVGFFKNLQAVIVDKDNRIWVVDTDGNYLQTFTPTSYANSIFDAIVSFNNHEYEKSRKSWEDVLQYDSLSVLGNDGLGKAYYYDKDFASSLKYFKISKNRSLYSNVFWELRNNFLQNNLSWIFLILIGAIAILVLFRYLFKHQKHFMKFASAVGKIKNTRVYKDLTVGFRLIVKPADTFYELKTRRRGSMLGATIYYVLGIIAFLLNTYCYALPFQYLTTVALNPSTVLVAAILVLAVFVLCNYLVSAINDGEGTFKDIYKFTGYSLLPIIICLPISVGVSYGLTLNEQVVLTILQVLGFWGFGLLLVVGVLETHNYTFGQTVKNILLTIVFMILFVIISMVVIIMLDQIKTFVEQIWKEVKLRAGWY